MENLKTPYALLLAKKGEIIPELTIKNWQIFHKELLITNQFELKEYKKNWIEEIQFSLKEINSNYLLISPSDFLCKKYISKNIDNFIRINNPNYIRLNLRPGAKNAKRRINYNDSIFYEIVANYDYSINLQPSIWKKSFLEKLLEVAKDKNLSIWEFDKKIFQYNNDKFIFVFESKIGNLFSSHYVKKGVQFRCFNHISSSYKKANIIQFIIFNFKLIIYTIKDFIEHLISVIYLK